MALALVTQLGGSQPSAAQSDRVPLGASAVDWTPLGALGPQGPRTLAVFPTWPANPTIVAERGADVILTRDGGQTLGAARWGTSSWLAHRTRLSSWVRTNDGQGYRSADLGQTWELTFDVRCTQDLAVSEPPRCDNPPQYGAPAVGPDIQVSPGFARDGTAYLSADGRLWLLPRRGAQLAAPRPRAGTARAELPALAGLRGRRHRRRGRGRWRLFPDLADARRIPVFRSRRQQRSAGLHRRGRYMDPSCCPVAWRWTISRISPCSASSSRPRIPRTARCSPSRGVTHRRAGRSERPWRP